ncbi:MAG: hypothetical protein Q4F11_09725, partial [Eubacteriales bacterium]|nr:hypothetical protein [Eubacteriales bacterium]
KSDGNTTASGGAAEFNLQSQINVQNVEIYYIRFDVKNNGSLSTQGYYGVDVKSGACYIVSLNGDSYTLTYF